jgi:hypothetical protein
MHRYKGHFMTLINTRDGGKTEARYHDIVKHGGIEFEVTHIDPENNYLFGVGQVLPIAASQCTLLSRPFQVGDEVVDTDGDYGIITEITEDGWCFCDYKMQGWEDINWELGVDVRHANPIWRNSND